MGEISARTVANGTDEYGVEALTETLERLQVLIIEDGDEYLRNLERFVTGPVYFQAHNGEEAHEILNSKEVNIDIVYLDMRFDRIPPEELLGDHAKVTEELNGDPARAWQYLKNNQGLYILAEIYEKYGNRLKVVIAYDFSRELKRFNNLKRLYPELKWVSDRVTFVEIKNIFEEFIFESVEE